MAADLNDQVVREMYAAYLWADLNTVLNACSDETDETEWPAFGPLNDLPYAGRHCGR